MPEVFPQYPPHLNAIQMILTLKMVGVAFEIHDTKLRGKKKGEEEEDEDAALARRFKDVHPSSSDIFHYSFSHAGLLTGKSFIPFENRFMCVLTVLPLPGPYYTYRSFHDLYFSEYTSKADCVQACLSRLSRLPLYVTLFLLAGYVFPLNVG